MSRVAKNPVALPAGVEAKFSAAELTIKGSLGSISVPLNGEVAGAKNLAEAVAGFPAAIKQAIADLREEMAAMQKERSSQIVIPGRDAPPPSDFLIR